MKCLTGHVKELIASSDENGKESTESSRTMNGTIRFVL